MLNEYEQKKYDTISKLVSKEITLKEAMQILKLQECQIYRLKKTFKEQGKEGFIHKNRGTSNPNKKDQIMIEEIKQLYLIEYSDYNFEHFYEDVIFSKYNISYDTMLKYFTKDDIISPLAHKKTVNEYNEKMKNAIKENNNTITEEKIELFKSRMLVIEKSHIRRSNNLFVFGQ